MLKSSIIGINLTKNILKIWKLSKYGELIRKSKNGQATTATKDSSLYQTSGGRGFVRLRWKLIPFVETIK
jgi:hypothetical protein